MIFWIFDGDVTITAKFNTLLPCIIISVSNKNKINVEPFYYLMVIFIIVNLIMVPI